MSEHRRPKHGKFQGKYRATVLNNVDPLQTGRLLVAVSDVSGLAHPTQELFGLGLGHAFKLVEQNPGQAIQAQVAACQT